MSQPSLNFSYENEFHIPQTPIGQLTILFSKGLSFDIYIAATHIASQIAPRIKPSINILPRSVLYKPLDKNWNEQNQIKRNHFKYTAGISNNTDNLRNKYCNTD